MMKQAASESSAPSGPTCCIRIVRRSVLCGICRSRIRGGGPIGYRGRRPVCDLCLFETSPELGMVIALIAVTRAFAAICSSAPREWLTPLRELGSFARVYELVAAKSGPMRAFPVSAIEQELGPYGDESGEIGREGRADDC